MSGIKDYKLNFESKKPNLFVAYKAPLKAIKAVINTMRNPTCKEKYSNIIFIAKDYSFGNPYILNELLYFYIVKNVLPSLNPSFENVVFYGEALLFKTKKYKEDKDETATIIDSDINNQISNLWMEKVMDIICERDRKFTFDDWKEMMMFSTYHYFLRTEKDYEP